MRRWLKECEKQIDKGEIEWWSLVHPLTDGSDAAKCILVQRLLAMWHWTVETSKSLICSPTLMILNIGQFLDEDMEKHGWDVQHWLEAYAYTLQWVGEAAVGRCWMPMGRDFAPRASLLVEVFTDVLNVEIPPVSAVSLGQSVGIHSSSER